MNKEQIIDEVYKNYLNEWTFEKYPNDGSVYSVEPIKVKEHSKEQFVYRCKTDTEFSEKWGLKIEERDLSYEERKKLCKLSDRVYPNNEWMKENNIPTQLITITYQTKTITSYE